MIYFVKRFILVIGTLLAIITATISLESIWWGFGIPAHFRLQMVITVAFIMILWKMLSIDKQGRSWWHLLFFTTLLMNVGAMIYGDWALIEYTDNSQLSVTHLNMDAWKSDHATAYDHLRTTKSDLLLLQEVTPAIAEELADQFSSYDVILSNPSWDTHGSVALLRDDASMIIETAELIYLPDDTTGRPLLFIRVLIDEEVINIVHFHATRPRNITTKLAQTTELESLAQWGNDALGHLLFIGDFNMTSWTQTFHQFLMDGQLNTIRPRAFEGTYPANFPSILRIPIDHAVFSEGITVTRYQVGKPVGSDHRPLTIQLHVRD